MCKAQRSSCRVSLLGTAVILLAARFCRTSLKILCLPCLDMTLYSLWQEGDVEGAQEQKSKLEQLQRSDQALRTAAKKAAAA